MKMFFLALLLIINTQVFAKDWGGEQEANVDRLILDFSIDKENKFHPDIYLPFSLSDELSAAISYHTTADYEKEKIEDEKGQIEDEILTPILAIFHLQFLLGKKLYRFPLLY